MAKKAKAKKREPELRPWPADKVERWALDRIREYPNNPRTHSDEQVEQIAASMRRFGVTAPVLVDEAGELIYGHGRLAAARKLGLAELPVAVARGWSEEEKRGYRIADNQLALASAWDMPLLQIEVDALRLSGFDLPLLGFDDETLGKLGIAEADFPLLPSGVAMEPDFRQFTFTVHKDQVEEVQTAIAAAKAAGPFEHSDYNSNGNALMRICEAYNGRRQGDRAAADRKPGCERAGQAAAL